MLTSGNRRDLRAKAHALKPVVTLGQRGVTPSLLASIDEALNVHELIKVKLRGVLREERTTTATLIAAGVGAEVVGVLGTVLTLYRVRPEDV